MFKLSTQNRPLRMGVLKDNSAVWMDRNGNGKQDPEDPILVKRQADGWEPVRDLPGSVDREELKKNYGFWTDSEVTKKEGIWPFRKETVERPVNGEIEADEVRTDKLETFGYGYTVGVEITEDPSTGNLFVEETSYLSQDPLVGERGRENAINNREYFRSQDHYWKVPLNQGRDS